MIKLSICIPTYNFGKFIGETLDSILPQVTDEVEVVVLDGGSTDDTAEVVGSRMKVYPQLVYHDQGYRGGIDRDIEKNVSLARGEYCWLFSSDDVMLPGAVEKILEAIRSKYDVYICEHILCSLEMVPISEHPPFNGITHQTLFDLGDEKQRKVYFRAARTSEAFFSFLAGPVFRKTVWDKAYVPESFRGTCWIVAGHLLSAIPTGLTVDYLHEKLMYKRCENDSFSDRGIVNRYRIAIEGLHFIANAVFGQESEEAFHIRRVIRNEIEIQPIIMVKFYAIKHPEQENLELLNKIVKMHYSDRTFHSMRCYAWYKLATPSLLWAAWKLRQLLRISFWEKIAIAVRKRYPNFWRVFVVRFIKPVYVAIRERLRPSVSKVTISLEESLALEKWRAEQLHAAHERSARPVCKGIDNEFPVVDAGSLLNRINKEQSRHLNQVIR